jgi:hypothetical protein
MNSTVGMTEEEAAREALLDAAMRAADEYAQRKPGERCRSVFEDIAMRRLHRAVERYREVIA